MNFRTYIKTKTFSTLLVLFFILQFQNSSEAIDINWTISGNTQYTNGDWTGNASANNTRNSGQCKSSNYRSSTHCLPTHYDNYAIGSNTLTLNMSSNLPTSLLCILYFDSK